MNIIMRVRVLKKKHFICSNVKCVTIKMFTESEAILMSITIDNGFSTS